MKKAIQSRLLLAVSLLLIVILSLNVRAEIITKEMGNSNYLVGEYLTGYNGGGVIPGTTLSFSPKEVLEKKFSGFNDLSVYEISICYGVEGYDDIGMYYLNIESDWESKIISFTIPADWGPHARVKVDFSIEKEETSGDDEIIYQYKYSSSDVYTAAGDLSETKIMGISNQTYTGSAIKQTPVVTLGTLQLVSGRDYTIAYENNINPGTASIILTGIGNFFGSKTQQFNIAPAKISVPAGKTLTYNGQLQTGVSSSAGYTIKNHTGTEAGEYTALLSLTNSKNYIWSDGILEDRLVSWKILPASINTDAVADIADAAYTGKAITPKPVVKVGSVSLTEGTDYTVAYADNVKAGIATVTVSGKGNYTGTVKKYFMISKTAGSVQKGAVYTVSKMKYMVTNPDMTGKGTVTLSGIAAGKKKLKKLTIPAAVMINGASFKIKAIAANAFKGCTNLTTLSIGKNVTSIGKNAFLNCAKLKTVTGGKGLTTFGASAFSGCKALTKITIYGKVKKIGAKAFYKCSKLKTITVKTSKLTFITVGANAFKGIYAKATIKVPKAKLKAYSTLLKKTGVGKKVTITK